MIVLPLAQTTREIAFPPFNGPMAMAAYLDEHIAPEALIETWEPEMGFLTNHNYHFPPQLLLNQAVGYIWLDKSPPAAMYTFVQDESPDYVLVGGFARWVELYPVETLTPHYSLLTTIGQYELYGLNK